MITDNFLFEMAKALANESYVVPSHLAFSSTVISASAADTTLSGEFGSRVAVTDSRSSNAVTFSGIRTGASVSSSSGETLNAAGLLSASSGGTLLTEALLSSIIHTTAFDVEVQWRFTVIRS